LNKCYTEMVVMSRALRGWFIITLKANTSQYPVPLNCFGISEVYYFDTATTYTKLDVVEESLVEERLSPGWQTIASTPSVAFQGDRNKMIGKLGVAPAPVADGTAPTLGSGISTAYQPYGVLDAVSGDAAPTSSGNTYVDSLAQDFEAMGVIPGLTILNITDGSSGTILTVSTSTITVILSGGSLNVWTPGDTMRIVGGEYGNSITIGQDDAAYILSATMGSLPYPGITMAAGNLLVRGFMFPGLLVDNYQYPELAPIFHSAIAIGAAGELAMEEPMDTPEFAQGQAYRQDFTNSIAQLSTFSATQYKTDGFAIQSRRR
jgi:hypothetical protein